MPCGLAARNLRVETEYRTYTKNITWSGQSFDSLVINQAVTVQRTACDHPGGMMDFWWHGSMICVSNFARFTPYVKVPRPSTSPFTH